MAVSLATLVSRLQAAVPAKDGIPTAADYSQHVQDAVFALSNDAPLRRIATLAVVSGTADYTLPTDFLFLIELPALTAPDGVMVNASGIVPLAADCDEEINIAGDVLTLTPTPTYTLNRAYRYAACHVLTDGGYPLLNENAARIALQYAQYLALSQQATALAGSAWKYSIGDETVDKSGQAKGYREAADAALAAYRRSMSQLKGYGV